MAGQLNYNKSPVPNYPSLPYSLGYAVIRLYCMYFACMPAGKHGYTADGGGGVIGDCHAFIFPREEPLLKGPLYTLQRGFSIEI